jgi:hypothetical protein
MKTYLFKTTATMKDNDQEKWWIDRNIINDKYIHAKTIEDALKQYVNIVDDCVSISNNAIKNRQPMFIDKKDGKTQQIGYVITGKTLFNNDRGKWIEKYIDLWIYISIVTTPDF